MKDKKDRRQESPERKFDTDYMRYDQNYGIQTALGPHRDERVVFADQAIKLNNRYIIFRLCEFILFMDFHFLFYECLLFFLLNRGRCERRDLILSVEAIYLVMRA